MAYDWDGYEKTEYMGQENIKEDIWTSGRSQWPRGLRRRSTAARLLRSWVRIPLGHGCLSVVSVVCCQLEVSATDWSLVQGSPTDCGASLCVIKKPRTQGGYSPLGLQNTNPQWVVMPVEKKIWTNGRTRNMENQAFREPYEDSDTVADVKKQRLEWIGYLVRMDRKG